MFFGLFYSVVARVLFRGALSLNRKKQNRQTVGDSA